MIKTEYEIVVNSHAGDHCTSLAIALATDLYEHNPKSVLQILRDAKTDVIAVAGDTLERHEHGENLDKGDRSMLSRLYSYEHRSQSKSKQRNGEPLYVIGRDDER